MPGMSPEDRQWARRMSREGLYRQVRRRWHDISMLVNEPLEVLLRRFPDFMVTDVVSPIGHVPVFFFHSVDPVKFEQGLQFLAENRYATLSLEELRQHLVNGAAVPQRSVVLTFDDGKLSVWQYAAPLLKKYDMFATVFVIAGYVAESETVRPTVADVWSGQGDGATLESSSDVGPKGLMNWSELRAMAGEGHLAVESHTLYHRRVFVGPKLLDFCTPAFPDEFYDVPLARGMQSCWLREPPDIPYGLPVFEYGPLTQARRLFRENEVLRNAVLEHVRTNGGPAFFTQPGWRRALLSLMKESNGPMGSFVSTRVIMDDMREEFAQARSLIRAKIPGASAKHLCLPYGAGSDQAVEVAKNVGYATCLWLLPPGRMYNRFGNDPFKICRVKHDWIFRLPGNGRHSLYALLRAKFARRCTDARRSLGKRGAVVGIGMASENSQSAPHHGNLP